MDRLISLLKEVKAISEKYEEISLLKGEKFNLFDILDRRTDEVKTHSAMIAELLNPKGSHGLGDEFLKLFLNYLNTNVLEKQNRIVFQDVSNTSVFTEYYIGEINDEKAVGGRIDIYLSNKQFNICIENKIFAGDQHLQLLRYHNFLNNKTGKLLIYLTLNGDDPNDTSIKCIEKNICLMKDVDYYGISYSVDILNWLQECLKSSVSYPILRESINQYIILIKSLTNQLTSTLMEEQVKKAILNDIASAEIIKDNFDKAVEVVANRLRDEVLEELQNYYPSAKRENARSNLISIFIPVSNGRLGIESFNGKGIFMNKALFVGLLMHNQENQKWEWENCTQIFDKKKLYEKLQNFEKGDIGIVNEIVDKVKEYINTKNIEVR
ncbi:MAG: PD-(D/E)XK nuclease family protein [Bacteroidales bacterium]|nr:PD-(D/E)XK nuclease family protein [Bacteroidales bacterium]